MQTTITSKRVNTRLLAVTGIMSAISFILMLLEFSIPSVIPSFVKLDFSELPALITSFAFGPLPGVMVCLIKNILHLTVTNSGGVGELANFLIGASFVFTAGLIYRRSKSRSSALIGSLAGALIMAAVSIPVNYFISYPFYAGAFFGGTMEPIIDMYKLILPAANNLLKALCFFNAPFTFIKAIFSVIITFIVYKPLSPILKK